MASYLLDTCVALWHFEGHARISAGLREVLTDPANELHLSDVSILEIVIKYRLGKLPLPRPPSRLVRPLALKHMMEILPLATSAILRLESLPDLHRDPFDRLLVCQALDRRLEIITPDPLIRQYDVPTAWR
jgi:PIN domain nuclease of toxin-antitoxin system